MTEQSGIYGGECPNEDVQLWVDGKLPTAMGAGLLVDSPLTFQEPCSTIFFATQEGEKAEILRIAKDGFYVRGVKLEQDEHEARKVWKAFTDWMKGMRIL